MRVRLPSLISQNDLAAKLEVVALLIDRVRTVAFDEDAVFRCGNDVFLPDFARVRLQADVRHSRKRNRCPVLRRTNIPGCLVTFVMSEIQSAISRVV